MSHEITSTDGLVLAGQPAWHGLGTVVEQAPTVREAFRVAGLTWNVERHPVLVDVGASTALANDQDPTSVVGSFDYKRDPSTVGLVRSDTRKILATVGSRYRPFQCDDLRDLIERLADRGALSKVETAGSLRGGRDVFALVPSGEFAAKPGTSDIVRTYRLFHNNNGGGQAVTIRPTGVRVVCANTLSAAFGSAATLSVRHTLGMLDRIAQAVKALKMGDELAAIRQEQVQHLAASAMSGNDRLVFFQKVYERSFGAIPANPRDAAEQRAYDRAADVMSKWLANLDSRRNSGTGTEGTVWHAFNAVTQWSDHERAIRSDSPGARAYSNLFGTSDAFKADAFAVAMQAAG